MELLNEAEGGGMSRNGGSCGGSSRRPSCEKAWALAALDAAPTATLVVDATGQIVFANHQVEQLFGRPASQLVDRPFEELLISADREVWRRKLASAVGGARPPAARCELTGLGVAGPLSVELTLGSFEGDGQRMAVVTVGDFTEKKLLREARERLEALLEFAPAFIIGITPDAKIEFINRTLPQYSRQETIGTSWLQYFEPARHALMTSVLETVYAKGTTETFEVATPGPDGSLLYFESHIAPVQVDGTIVGAVLVSQEVTERKRAHAELVAGRQMALLGTLAAGVAHEINTPIQFVGDSIQFLRTSTQDLFTLHDRLRELRRSARDGAPLEGLILAVEMAEQEADLPYLRENMPDAFDRCVEGLNHVATIVRSLKDFAHPPNKEKMPADLNRAVQTSLTIARNEYKYVADVETDFHELPPVMCHVNEIGQVLLNILINAGHAIADVVRGTDRRGLITVSTRLEGETAVIAIHDSGGGIPENIQARIFDPFFTTKDVGKGTGQGLAIALSTVKDGHGGNLTFESKAGEGTTFFIRLPIANA
jgi:PAS domain S-box-containing protein